MTSRIWNILGLGILAWPLALSSAPPAAADARPATDSKPISDGKPAGDGKPAAYPEMASVEQYLMADRKAEITLARSAAPPSISTDASVLVLTRRGYEVAETGKNGFVCLVDRSWQNTFGDPQFWNPKIRSPVCLNAAAARSVLPIANRQTELALARLPQTEILARMKRAVDHHEFGAPEVGAMSYMMSRDQYLNDDATHWHPHVMFYLPGTVESGAMGANLPRSPVIGLPQPLPGGGRMPVTVYIVPVGHWSDGTAAESHDPH